MRVPLSIVRMLPMVFIVGPFRLHHANADLLHKRPGQEINLFRPFYTDPSTDVNSLGRLDDLQPRQLASGTTPLTQLRSV